MAINFKTTITDNLADARLAPVEEYLRNLIDRRYNGHTETISRYRITTDVAVPVAIKTVAELVAAIDNTKIQVKTSYKAGKHLGLSIPDMTVVITNLVVTFDENEKTDSKFMNEHNVRKARLVFVMNYLCDNDTVLPIKITEIRLIEI